MKGLVNVYNLAPTTVSIHLLESNSAGKANVNFIDIFFLSAEAFACIDALGIVALNMEFKAVNANFIAKSTSSYPFSGYGIPNTATSEAILAKIRFEAILSRFCINAENNYADVGSVSVDAADHTLDIVVGSLLYWYRRFKETLNDITARCNEYYRGTRLLLLVMVLCEEQGDSKNIPPMETFGRKPVDVLSAVITYNRIAFQSLRYTQKWMLLTTGSDHSCESIDVQSSLRKLCSFALRNFGIFTNWVLLPDWLFYFGSKEPKYTLMDETVEVMTNALFSKIIFSLHNSSKVVGLFTLDSIKVALKFTQLYLASTKEFFWEQVFVFSSTQATLNITQNMVSFVLDWIEVKNIDVANPDKVPATNLTFSRYFKLSLYFKVEKLMASVNEQTVGCYLEIQNPIVSLLYLPRHAEASSSKSVWSSCLKFKTLTINFNELSNLTGDPSLLKVELTQFRSLLDFLHQHDGQVFATTVIDSVSVKIPKSILHIQLFLEKLRSSMPRYAAALTNSSSHVPELSRETRCDVLIAAVSIQSQLLKYFQFSYHAVDYALSLDNIPLNELSSKISYIYNIRQQMLRFSDIEEYAIPPSFSRGEIKYSRSEVNASWDVCLDAIVALDKFEQRINVELLEKVDRVYSVISEEFTDLVRVISHYANQRRNQMRMVPRLQSDPSDSKIELTVSLKIKDSLIILEGPHDSVSLKSDVISGIIKKTALDFNWGFTVRGMEIDLGYSVNASQRIASAVIDVYLEHVGSASTYMLKSKRIFVLLQPSALTQGLKLYQYWAKEISIRNENRRLEIAQMHSNASSLLTSLQMGLKSDCKKESEVSVSFEFEHIAGAIIVDGVPLDGRSRSQKFLEVLLVSFKNARVTWLKSDYESDIGDWGLFFISAFDPLNKSHYEPDMHSPTNYASMPHASIKYTNKSNSQKECRTIISEIQGFTVGLDSSITTQIRKIFMIYEKINAKELFSASDSEFNGATLGRAFGSIESVFIDANAAEGWKILQLVAFLNFDGMVLKMVTRNAKRIGIKTKPMESLEFPGLKVEIQGRTVIGNSNSKDSSKGLFVDFIFQPSENTIKPEIVGFLKGKAYIDSDIWKNFRTEQSNRSKISTLSARHIEESTLNDFYDGYTGQINYRNHPLTFTVTFPKTIVNMSCLPYANVVCNMSIDSATILISFLPDGEFKQKHRYLNCTLLITKPRLTLGCESTCLKSEMEKISGNVTIDHQQKTGISISTQWSVPIVSAHINMRQIEDLLIFQLLWSASNIKDIIIPANGGPELYNGEENKDMFALIANVGVLDITSDLGPSLGKVKLCIKNVGIDLNSVWKNSIILSRHFFGSVTTVMIEIEGRLGGVILLESFYVDMSGSSVNDIGLRTIGRLSIEKLNIELNHLTERLLIADVSVVTVQIDDTWKDMYVLLKILIQLDAVSVCISKQTIYRVEKYINRVVSYINERKLQADILISKSAPYLLRSETKTVMISRAPRMAFNIPKFNGNVAIDVNFKGKSIFVTLAGNNFRDPICSQIQISDLMAHYSEKIVTHVNLHEECEIKFESFFVKRTVLRLVSHQEERIWTIDQWLTFLKVSAGHTIISVSKTSLDLLTDSRLVENVVEYSLDTKFNQGLDVSLNLGLYKFLQELIETYAQAGIEIEEEFGSDRRISEPPNLQPKIVFIPSQPLIFVQKGEFNFDPQLKLMGEATPQDLLVRLGLKKEKIPEFVYSNVLYLSSVARAVGYAYKKFVIIPKEDIFLSPDRQSLFTPGTAPFDDLEI